MSLLGFKDRFVTKIECGDKRHTIRGIRQDIKVGTRLDLYARPRAKDMRLIFRAPCVRIETIKICLSFSGDAQFPELAIKLGDFWLTGGERIVFAKSDGFDSAEDMALYWEKLRPAQFEGRVYHWDFLRRTMEAF